MCNQEKIDELKDTMSRAIYDAIYYILDEDDSRYLAETLMDAGYRKASDVALEVIKKVEQILTVKIIGIEEDLFHGTAAHWDGTRRNCYEELLVELADLKKKYESEGTDDDCN